MNCQDREISDVLKCFVKRQSEGEYDFIDKQTKYGIKICDRISHQRSRDGKDELVIETQLSSSNDQSDSSINRACTLIGTENPVDNNDTNKNNNNEHYFIKQLMVSQNKSKSLDIDQATHLTAVVGNNVQPYEAVFSAVVAHSDHGRQLLQQHSFVRDATMAPASCHSLPDKITNALLPPSNSDKSNTGTRSKKPKKSKSWRSLFPLHKKKSTGAPVATDSIDKLAKQRIVDSTTVTKIEAGSLLESSFPKEDVPFKSHKIGQPLQRMKKRKTIPDFIKNILTPKNNFLNMKICGHRDRCDSNNNEMRPPSLVGEVTNYEQDQEGYVTKIVTRLSRLDDAQDATIDPIVTSVDDRRSEDVEELSSFHFDMSICADPRRTRSPGGPDKLCDCYTRRLDLIARGINVVIHRTKGHDILAEMALFDKETFHLKDCPFNSISVPPRQNSMSSTRQSRVSLYQLCEYCNNADEQLHPEISAHLLPVINRLEDDDEINFNDDHLRFFLAAKCYKEFEKGMGQAVGFKCSIRNLAHLHYVTRKVVRHIGDPNNEDNEHIRRIMHFAEQFCAEHYNSRIELHGSLEEFLRQHKQQQQDID